jgi:hypothetical protein
MLRWGMDAGQKPLLINNFGPRHFPQSFLCRPFCVSSSWKMYTAVIHLLPARKMGEYLLHVRSRDSSAMGYWLDVGGSNRGRGWEFFSSPPRSDRLWGLPSLLSSGYQDVFPCGWSGRGVKLNSYFHLVPRSRMRGAIPSLSQYTFMAWCWVKAQWQLYHLPLYAPCILQN